MSKKTNARRSVSARDANDTMLELIGPAPDHKMHHGKCAVCKRQGAELVAPCPGYPTAAEAGGHAVQPGPSPKPGVRRVTTAVVSKPVPAPVAPVVSVKPPKAKPAPVAPKAKKSRTPATPVAPIDDKLRATIRAKYDKHKDEGKCAAIRALASYPVEAVLQALPELSPSTVRIQHRSAQ